MELGHAMAVYAGSGVFMLLLLLLFRANRINRSLRSDSERILLGVRSLARSGKAPQRIGIKNSKNLTLWRKILSFYAATLRTGSTKADLVTVLGGGAGLLDAGHSEDKVLQVLAELVLRSASPEARFSGVLVRSPGSGWKLVAASGIAGERIEEPLVSAVDRLCVEEEGFYYTQPRDGIVFDFRGLGAGTSLFVPMIGSEGVFGVVWLGFSEGSGVLQESRKATIEMIIRHAVASCNSARRSKVKEEHGALQKEKMLLLSHDMKAPGMRALYALREVQYALQGHDEQQEYLLSEIEYALEEQLGMIDSVFSLDSAEQSYQQPSPEIEISSMVRHRVESFRVIARAASINLTTSVLDRAKVRIPREVIFRILDNLLTNAIKYTPDGSIDVSVILKGTEKVEISVRDTGKGVPERLIKSLFSGEIRAVEREINSGHGYGLTAVKRLVVEHGGTVGYRPDPSGGSVFSFVLPVTSVLEGGFRMSADRQGHGVLVIDDDAILRSTYERWLKDSVDRVISCSGFTEARVAMGFERPAMVIMDVTIPGEDAGEFIASLPEDIPLIIISGMPVNVLYEQFSVYKQVVRVLEKPFTRAQLRELLKRYFTMQVLPGVEKAA
jgi:signal transduction histidine kinase/CheY-like chemotaxis protein